MLGLRTDVEKTRCIGIDKLLKVVWNIKDVAKDYGNPGIKDRWSIESSTEAKTKVTFALN